MSCVMCKFNEILGNKAAPLFKKHSKETDKCFVTYNLITDARFACIQFYISGGRLSTAMPRSEYGDNDLKLQQLIKNLQ